MNAHTVFACESLPVMVEGLKTVLSESGEFALTGHASSTLEALPLILGEKPHLVLIDHAMGLRSAAQLAGELREAGSKTGCILWAHELGESESLRSLQAGIRGIVGRTQPVSSLLECLRAVAQGGVWLEHPLVRHPEEPRAHRSAPRFTPREREIVDLVCRGFKNRQIAEALSITPGTVKVHLMHIFEKAGVRDRFELAMRGSQLIEREHPASAPLAGS